MMSYIASTGLIPVALLRTQRGWSTDTTITYDYEPRSPFVLENMDDTIGQDPKNLPQLLMGSE